MQGLLTVMLTLSLAMPALAQGPGGGRGRGMMLPTIEEFTARLKLEPSQVEKIKPLVEKYMTDTKGAREVLQANMQAIRNGETTREAVQAENQAAMMVVRDNRETLNKAIRACLTPEQQKEFDAWQAELAAQRQQRPGA